MAKILKSMATKKDMLFVNGTAIKNLPELYQAIAAMSEQEFEQQVNMKRYAKWVKQAFNDKDPAKNLLIVPDKESVLFCLENRIKIEKPRLTRKPEVHVQRSKKSLTPRTGNFLLGDIAKTFNK